MSKILLIVDDYTVISMTVSTSGYEMFEAENGNLSAFKAINEEIKAMFRNLDERISEHACFDAKKQVRTTKHS